MDIHFMLVYAQDYIVVLRASFNKPQHSNDASKLMIQ